MAGKVRDEIHQRRPHASVEEEAFLNIVRTADALTRDFEDLLKPHGLTGTQYNLLRILRGAGKRGATCSEIGERAIKKDPDITRLVDRMEKRGLVKRSRDGRDRRLVTTSITAEGLRKLDELEGPINKIPIQQFQGLSKQKILELIQTLETLRQRVS
jgi:DNA-binding MarR family transcriptional regulator